MKARTGRDVVDRRRRPARFAIVGVTATTIDIGLAVLLADPTGRLIADLVALLAAAVASRLLHDRYTLRGDRLDRWIRRPAVFGSVAVLAGAVDLVVFLSLGSVRVWLAKCLAVSAAALVRAVAHRAVLFRAVRRAQDHPTRRPPVESPVRLSIVVPAYREADRIGATVDRLRTELDRLGAVEIVVVDDGSGDGTAAAAEEAGADRVVELPENRGKGAAVRAGMAESTGAVVAFTDADLAYPPAQLTKLLERIEAGWDVVIGDRHHPDTLTLRGPSTVRSLGSRAVNIATHVLLRGNYRDTQCGLKAFRSDVAGAVFSRTTIDGFAFDIEVLHLIERYQLSLAHVPVEVVNSETSTVRALRDGLAVARDIVLIRWRSRRGRYARLAPDALPAPAGRPRPLDLDRERQR